MSFARDPLTSPAYMTASPMRGTRNIAAITHINNINNSNNSSNLLTSHPHHSLTNAPSSHPHPLPSLSSLHSIGARVSLLSLRAYSFLSLLLLRYSSLRVRLSEVETQEHTARARLDREVSRSELAKIELEYSLEIIAFITQIIGELRAQQAQQQAQQQAMQHHHTHANASSSPTNSPSASRLAAPQPHGQGFNSPHHSPHPSLSPPQTPPPHSHSNQQVSSPSPPSSLSSSPSFSSSSSSSAAAAGLPFLSIPLRFPRASAASEKFQHLASRLVAQRRGGQANSSTAMALASAAAAANAGMNRQQQQQQQQQQAARRPSIHSSSSSQSLASPSPSPSAPAATSTPSFGVGIGFLGGSLLGLYGGSSLTSAGANVNNPNANANANNQTNYGANGQQQNNTLSQTTGLARAASHSESSNSHNYNNNNNQGSLPSSLSVIGQYFSQTSSNSSSTASSASSSLSHGFSSHQNLKGLPLTMSMNNKPNEKERERSNNKGFGRNPHLVPVDPTGRSIQQQQQQQQQQSQSYVDAVAPLSNTPVTKSALSILSSKPFLPSQQAAASSSSSSSATTTSTPTAAATTTAAPFVLLSPSELIPCLLSLCGDDLLLLHRRYSEDIHAPIWSSLLSLRHSRDASLRSMQLLMEEREECSKELLEVTDLSFHFKHMLQSSRNMVQQQQAQQAAALSPSNSHTGVGLATSALNLLQSSELDEQALPVLAHYDELFAAHPVQPTRSWSELVQSRSSSLRPTLAQGVELLAELIEWHRRFIDANRQMENNANANATHNNNNSKINNNLQAQQQRDFNMARGFSQQELKRTDNSAISIN